MRKSAGAALHEIEALRGSDPQMSRMVLEQGAHIVARERGRTRWVMAKSLDDASSRVHPVEAAIESSDPKASAPIFDDRRDLRAARRVRIAALRAEVHESAALRLPAIQAPGGPGPHGTGTIQRQREDLVVAQRIGVARIVLQMLDVARAGIEHIDAGIIRSYPDAAARVHQHGARDIARERSRIFGIVPIVSEAVRRPIPAGESRILDRDPQVVMVVLDDLANEVPRQPP